MMPRPPRIEFEGAIYHVMARGNHGSDIVFSDDDRRCFIDTLNESCTRTGWQCYAWVLMSNHYHMAIRTPQANLVTGMTWFQQAFTQRINARNRLRGHLFGGRYKSILVENQDLTGTRYRSDYLANLIQYIHLNPSRAGLIDGSDRRVLDYQWSSVAQWYGVAPSKRPKHAMVVEGLSILRCKDTVAGRRGYISELDETTRQEAAMEQGYYLPEEQSLQSTLKRGWYWGSEFFKEALLDKISAEVSEALSKKRDDATKLSDDHSERRAAQIIAQAKDLLCMDEAQLTRNQRGDESRNAIAYVLATQTTLSHQRIGAVLNFKNTPVTSQRINRFRKLDHSKLDKSIRKFLKMSKY